MAAAVTYVAGAAAPSAAADRTTRRGLGTATVPIPEYDVSKVIYEKGIKARPFLVVLERIGSKTGFNDTHFWDEDEAVPEHDTIDGSIEVGGTSIVVTNAAQYTVWDVIYIRDNAAQGIVLTSTVATNTITVQWTHPPVAAIADGAVIVKTGNCHEQISQYVIMPTTIPAQLYNRFQDMRHAVGFSTQRLHTPDRVSEHDVKRQVRKMLQEHQREKEKTLIFGQQILYVNGVAALLGTSTLGLCEGVYHASATNQTNLAGAVLTRAAFDTFLLGVMQINTQDNQNWVLLCSTLIWQRISGFGIGYEQLRTEDTKFGFRAKVYTAPAQKDVTIICHPLFDQLGYTDLGILVNVGEDAFNYVSHRGLATKMFTGTQPYGRSALEKWVWTVFTGEWKGEEINLALLELSLIHI